MRVFNGWAAVLVLCASGALWAGGKAKPAVSVSAGRFKAVHLVSTGWEDTVRNDQMNLVSDLMDGVEITQVGETEPEVQANFGKVMDEAMKSLGFRRLDAAVAAGLHKYARNGQPGVLVGSPAFAEALHYVPADQLAFKDLVEDDARFQLVGSRSLGRASGSVENVYVQISAKGFTFKGSGATFTASVAITVEGDVAFERQKVRRGPIRMLSVDLSMVNTEGLHREVMKAILGVKNAGGLAVLRQMAADCTRIEDEGRAKWLQAAKEKGFDPKTHIAQVCGLVDGGKDNWGDMLKGMVAQVESGKVDAEAAFMVLRDRVVPGVEKAIRSISSFLDEENDVSMKNLLKKDGRDPASEMAASHVRLEVNQKVLEVLRAPKS
jgi:hypothetical protein